MKSVFPVHVPPAALRSLVADAHGYKVPANPTGLHRGLPSRHLTLVVELNAPLRVAGFGGSVAAHGVVGGLHTRPVLIDASSPQEGLQYALTPLGCQSLLGAPASELCGHAVDLVSLLRYEFHLCRGGRGVAHGVRQRRADEGRGGG